MKKLFWDDGPGPVTLFGTILMIASGVIFAVHKTDEFTRWPGKELQAIFDSVEEGTHWEISKDKIQTKDGSIVIEKVVGDRWSITKPDYPISYKFSNLIKSHLKKIKKSDLTDALAKATGQQDFLRIPVEEELAEEDRVKLRLAIKILIKQFAKGEVK